MTLLAHQLRAPLTTISALAQGLARRGHRMTQEDVREGGRKIWDASRRLNELIGTIMNYARANAGGIIPEHREFNLRATLLRIVKEQEQLSGAQRCQVDLDALPARIEGDPALIEQAISIVIANALQYSDKNSLVLIHGHANTRTITITVSDTGVGISAADLPLVTQPFFRGANVRHLPGTGLGLSLARHIVSLHAGSLEIESKEDQGTLVQIKLPRKV